MASKMTRSGILQTETAQYHPGTGHTQCPNEKCGRIIGSASLTCKHCGRTRIPASKKDHYVNREKTVPVSVHNALLKEFNRLQKELDNAKKMTVAKAIAALKNL